MIGIGGFSKVFLGIIYIIYKQDIKLHKNIML